jgi:hypothetical protein
MAELPAFLEQKGPVLIDFAKRLDLSEPELVVTNPAQCLDAISVFMRDQLVNEDDRVWILTRLGYLIGELLVRRFEGDWFLNDIPDSKYFLHYVVGRFQRIKNPDAMVAPFEVANHFLSQESGRDLALLVSEVERGLQAA